MKKLLICLALAFSLVTLGACGKNESAKPTSSTNNHQSKGQGQVTLVLKTEKESKKIRRIQKGDTVLDVLKEYILFKKMMVLLLKLMEFLKTRRRGFIGCLMSMEKSVRKLLINLKFKMVMKSNSTKKSIIKILDSNSESFFIKFGNRTNNFLIKVRN